MDLPTVSRPTDKLSVQSVTTDIDQDMGLWTLEAIQQQNEKFTANKHESNAR